MTEQTEETPEFLARQVEIAQTLITDLTRVARRVGGEILVEFPKVTPTDTQSRFDVAREKVLARMTAEERAYTAGVAIGTQRAGRALKEARDQLLNHEV